MCRKKGFSLDG
ncbi:hypothetical protein F383_38337 [Gossypium arboreum]|uniref:Uncharacterized protein n=1 Tax=Gossypium arboreum TaxID=29729 RepID=A0A0B0MIV7_GOSAR|nr:hypothetical protein F383_38337 [Gossypium arboreum]